MRKKSETADPLNGRNRLLDTAVRLFARDGFDGTSVRAVADEAGVAWSLVRFYFGSKDGLRDAAEKHVMSGYLARVRAAGNVASAQELVSVIETQTEGLSDMARFLRRAITEDRPVALEFMRMLLDEIEAGFANAADDADEPGLQDPVRALVSRLGYLLIAPQIEALSGRDPFSVEELKRRNLQEMRISELIARGLEAERAEQHQQQGT